MPNIPGWFKSRRHDHVWVLRDYNIVAKIEGSRGQWHGTIKDNEFNGRYDFKYSDSRYGEVKNRLVDKMRMISKQV
jgi:1,2-phenylacetyl-CoA epoxidase PaaB subunit